MSIPGGRTLLVHKEKCNTDSLASDMQRKNDKFNLPPGPILLRRMALRTMLIAIGIGLLLTVISFFSLGLVTPIALLLGQLIMIFSFQTTDAITRERYQLVTEWNYVIAGVACIVAALTTGIFYYLGCSAFQALHIYDINIIPSINCHAQDISDIAKRSALASGVGLALYVGFFSFLLKYRRS